jgi:hypothetical protein
MNPAVKLTPLAEGRRPVLVASHARSGTHFTMNAIAKAFGHVSNPWVDLDYHHFNINYHHAKTLASNVMALGLKRPANILKSHHEFEFFGDNLEGVAEVWDVVYVHRHPADVLASYWRYLHTFHSDEGPRTATVLELATHAPWGRMMRYQYGQHATVLDRWAHHVAGWVEAAERTGRVRVVRYEDLANDYAGALRGLGAALGLAPADLAPPSRTKDVVTGGPAPFTPPPGGDNRAAVGELAHARHRELMARLGYGAELRSASA